MTFIEWRDELDSYLGDMNAKDKKKVFSYFSEMYADKREAGMSEREIVAEFGAPFDAAQRILSEDRTSKTENSGGDMAETKDKKSAKKAKKSSSSAAGVLLAIFLCVILFGPFVALFSVAVSATVTCAVVPVAMIAGGVYAVVSAVAIAVTGEVAAGIFSVGAGLISLGAGLILAPLLFKLIKLIWKLVGALCSAITKLCNGEA